MFGRRHDHDVLLWSGTDVAWPSFANAAHVCFTNDNGLVSENANFLRSMMLGPIDNSENWDFCDIDFQGSVASITTINPPGGDSIVRAAAVGLPTIGAGLAASTFFSQHPLELADIPLTKVDAWCSDGLGGVTQNPASTPPFHGSWLGATFSTNLFFAGWPFSGAAITAADRWSLQFSVGRATPFGTVSISGYRKFWIALKSINPNLVALSPSAMAITGSIYAHLYEFRPRR